LCTVIFYIPLTIDSIRYRNIAFNRLFFLSSNINLTLNLCWDKSLFCGQLPVIIQIQLLYKRAPQEANPARRFRHLTHEIKL
jgi:hypothetical protein